MLPLRECLRCLLTYSPLWLCTNFRLRSYGVMANISLQVFSGSLRRGRRKSIRQRIHTVISDALMVRIMYLLRDLMFHSQMGQFSCDYVQKIFPSGHPSTPWTSDPGFQAMLAMTQKYRCPRSATPPHAPTMYTAWLSQPGRKLTVSYPLLALTFGPYLNSAQGTGNKAREMKPSRLVAHAMPSLLYTSETSAPITRRY